MFLQLTTLLLALVSFALSHSWVERLMVVASNGTMIGAPGFIRGAVSRSTPAFHDLQMQHLLPITPEGFFSDQICKNTQTTRNYTTALPALQAYSGDFIALQYQENGHVTLPELTPQKESVGSVYIYGTFDPRNNESLSSVHKVWNSDGTGGDQRGRLIAIRSFDDKQCYQINSGPNSELRQTNYQKVAKDPQGADLWCQNNIRLPLYVPHRSWYTLYWVWDWPSAPSNNLPGGKLEIYTSCMDIIMRPGDNQSGINFIDGQDLNLAGIKEQLQNAD
ncbi:hypothetical protein QQS21_002097 [Conoideocrella luteorostrata]|uniref:DUF7492 domain-containing protein n=1 Tax=Conoideocrella luteorostrata TaxID=1105319 RepID=A0AAJ0CVV5_9HYPO|nr:hypothetical protein QQS21_002097 [Conoideocrella luteorostrata]